MSDPTGRLLGVDTGHVRIGLAVCDRDRKIASALSTFTRRDREAEARYFRQLMQEENIAGIVIGLPVHLSGHESQKSAEARAFGAWLNNLCGLSVTYWDERFSTVEAEQYLLDAGLTSKRRKARRDQLAAQIMLQSYLDAGCPGETRPLALDG